MKYLPSILAISLFIFFCSPNAPKNGPNPNDPKFIGTWSPIGGKGIFTFHPDATFDIFDSLPRIHCIGITLKSIKPLQTSL